MYRLRVLVFQCPLSMFSHPHNFIYSYISELSQKVSTYQFLQILDGHQSLILYISVPEMVDPKTRPILRPDDQETGEVGDDPKKRDILVLQVEGYTSCSHLVKKSLKKFGRTTTLKTTWQRIL